MSQEWQVASKSRHIDPAGYLSNKTIAALCTATGGAIALVRVSGVQAVSVYEKLSGKKFSPDQNRKAIRTWIYDRSGKRLDDVVAIVFLNPHSFTGEDVLELSMHGSPLIVQNVLDEILSLDVRQALPGEFSFRAVKNGKMNLTQAEAVKELIEAKSEQALSIAIDKLSGAQHQLVLKIREELFQLVTLSEAGIDFSDQDLDEVSLPTLKKKVESIAKKIRHLIGSFERAKKLNDGILVSILGLPNVGKSSFFNVLLGEDRAIVSSMAGTTRDIVREYLQLKHQSQAVTFRISDTAGLRKTADQIEEIGIIRSIQSANDAQWVLILVDASKPNWDSLKEMLKQINWTEKHVLFVLTKVDLLDKTALDSVIKDSTQFSEAVFQQAHPILPVSSYDLYGIQDLVEMMVKRACKQVERNQGEVWLTSLSHVQAAQNCLSSLDRAMIAQDSVLFANDIRHAMNDLGPLIGETLTDDILGKIFSDFCIGK